MAKRLKLKISRVLPSFQSCRSKDPSSLPENPLPVIFHLSPVNPKPIDINFPVSPPRPPTRSSSFRRHVSSALVSVGCGCRSKSGLQIISGEDGSQWYSQESRSDFQWKKDEKWHVVEQHPHVQPHRRKIISVPPSDENKKKQRKKKKKTTKPRIRVSTSSADSGWFSSEEREREDLYNDETETLVSSRSFSTDSSDFNSHLKPIRELPGLGRKKKVSKKVKLGRRKNNNGNKAKPTSEFCPPSPETDSPARVSVFRRLIPCSVEGKVRESFAVVKRSEDPYEDFKRSMMEMILEKQMFEAKDLEQLLHCFLSLNSRAHHHLIVEAFSEIWEILFCKSTGVLSEGP
ncbi:ovate family protein 7 [Tasmannia lanceolata]|uniref:ovate family protein 7 n=1 Tax=Tasmannia lanceolata TaxID=3420 RepID=UPI004062DE47